MSIIELKEREDISENVKISRIYIQLQEFLSELRKKKLPHKIIELVNQDIEDLNSTSLICNELSKLVKQKQEKIIKLLEKERKIVPKDYYQNLWLVLGMCTFGVPLGVVFGTSLGNMGLLGIGLPIGLVIGIALGSRMDKKAFEEGRQLDIKIKY